MVDARWHTATDRTVSPEDYAVQAAADRDLAAQFHQYLTLNDTQDADQIVAEEAIEILTLCSRMQVTTPAAHNLTLVMSMRAIEDVAIQSEQRGDGIQAAWCRTLNKKLGGGH